MQFLGQHFLKNISAIKKIIAALDIQPGETIIEIGSGRGALTFPLLEECAQKKCKLIAIEKDPLLVKSLKLKVFGEKDSEDNRSNLEIIEGDALKMLPEIIRNLKLTNLQTYKLVGNIPYYITGKLLRTISELTNKPSISVLMVQKEVAERICAQPKLSLRVPPKPRLAGPHRGLLAMTEEERLSSFARSRIAMTTSQTPRNDKKRKTSNGMNLLAAATQYWASPEIILNLKAKEFDPPPEVDSAVIKLTTRNKNINSSLSLRVLPKPRLAGPRRGLLAMTEEERLSSFARSRIAMTTSRTPRNDGINTNGETEESENYYKLVHIIFKQPRKTLANNLKDGLNISRTETEKILNTVDLPPNSRPQDISVEKIIKLSQMNLQPQYNIN